MRTFHLVPTPFALAAFLLASAAAHAQTSTAAAAGDAPTMPTVVVNASADASAQGLSKAYAGGQVARGGRMGILGAVDMMDSPFGSTSYTQQFIADQQARSVGDLLQSDGAVRMSRGYGNFQEVYVIRGFALDSDDVAYNGLYGVLPRQYVSPELLERVEVFRGASAFLNGAAPGGSGIGGAINLMPKRAGNTPLTELTVGVESGGHAYAAIDVARRFGEQQEFGVRVNAAKRQGETGIQREDHDVGMFSVGLDYRGRGYRLSADAGYQNFDLTAPRPSINTGSLTALPGAPDASKNFAQPWSYSKEHDVFGTARAEVDLAKDVVAWAAFGSRSTKEANSLAQPTLSALNGDASVYRFDNARKQEIRTGELGVRGKLHTGAVRHTLVASWSGHWNEAKNAYAISDYAGLPTNIYHPLDVAMPPTVPANSGGVMSDPRLTQKTILNSYAVADTMAFLDDRLLLTVGLRRQQIRDAAYAYGTAVQYSSYDKSATTPVAGIVYKAGKNVSVYANYIEALVKGPVASGTYFDGQNDVPLSNKGEVFSPYKSKQKEIGVKYDGGRLGMSAALFSTAKPLPAVVGSRATLSGEQRNQGLELSVFGTPMAGVRLLGGLTWLDTEQRKTDKPANNGKNAIGAPKTQLSVGGEWDVPDAPGLSLNARTVYTSTQYADLANSKQLPSWTRVDIGARYLTQVAGHDVTLRARIDNVADRSYWASAVSSFDAGSLVLAAPRTFVVSGSVAF
ncbi:ferrichrome receptor FcuA precursor [Janthinobacterium sp. HH103]|uniref:TonB-dependent receptor n=1 Tax=unclassified Janthinobacterium TaxID=2610881 RepID=UPI0008739A96|nr:MULTISPECIES: TonB-dependent receptor [unclassified Janthinobacterium]OEZ72956.1 ferrichrome receptor FcuA precursor [Janthinobacterium sp. HH100]OEZ85902.1 ferrichrome receptor FcuA precursor [Janthinobacterium sp. HH103]QOU73649.1 Ferrichrome receptor FcuA [Janthinobacterium sp. HH102]